jgi:di/tricarboxylate transporter
MDKEALDLILNTPIAWQGWLTIVVFILTIYALFKEIRAPEVILLFSTGILLIFGVLNPEKFLSGFSNDILVTIAMLCVVGRALEVNGLLAFIAEKLLSHSQSVPLQMASYMVPMTFVSAFLNNTPVALLMTPIVRDFALKMGKSPSKYLIQVSYAAIFGGMCTLIGTSTNIIVAGLLKKTNEQAALSFFEIGKVGVPLAIISILYTIFIGRHFLPDRQDVKEALNKQIKDFTSEFLIGKGCPFIGKSIGELSKKYFPEQTIVQVKRGETFIDSPSLELILLEGDQVVFVGYLEKIVQLHAIDGLQTLADPHFDFDSDSSHFTEVVVTTTSWLIGKTLKKIQFRKHYQASVLAIYRQGERVKGDVRNTELQAGDTLMLLSQETWQGSLYENKDFYVIRDPEKLPCFDKKKVWWVCGITFGMIGAMILGVSVLVASLLAVFSLILTKSLSIREAKNSIIWETLLLIALTFGLAEAVVSTGLALKFSAFFLSIVGDHPLAFIGGILFITIVATEFLSNNATALLMFPIALETARLAGYESINAMKAIGIAVAIGSSTGFAVPTAYQTHMIVFGPGGYKFKDFVKIGVSLDLIYLVFSTILIFLIYLK